MGIIITADTKPSVEQLKGRKMDYVLKYLYKTLYNYFRVGRYYNGK